VKSETRARGAAKENAEFIEKAGFFLIYLFYISPRSVEHLSTEEEQDTPLRDNGIRTTGQNSCNYSKNRKCLGIGNTWKNHSGVLSQSL
jgi:hypothetical protein